MAALPGGEDGDAGLRPHGREKREDEDFVEETRSKTGDERSL